ncbi:MAG: ychM [Bacteriovoracaceae bacterium]|nr:ychM [Bacteriovoracaceae bacterium]
MPNRYKELPEDSTFSFRFEPQKIKLFAALRERLSEGYSKKNFLSDLMSGIIVALVALPLSMALAIASDVAPQFGLYTSIFAGFLVALFGGSRLQVTGPTAAFVVILVPIVGKFGFGGLLIAGFLAGVILILMGILKLGRLIEFIPYPVTTGFTSGIALVIGTIQLKDFFGLQIQKMPETYFERLKILIQAAPTASMTEFLIAASTLCLLIIWPRDFFSKMTLGWNKKIPAPLTALSLVTIGTLFAKHFFPDIQFSTIQSKFSYVKDGVLIPGIPQSLPSLAWPWSQPGPNGSSLQLNLDLFKSLLPSAFVIAMLGAIESLLSAVVVDGMAKTKHDPDSELVALGIGNIVCPFFGGIAATGAIARTTTNFRFGATSPFSSMIHAIFILLVLILFAPYVGYLPMASMAALLILVAYNMAQLKHFTRIIRVAPRSDVAVLLICFFLTVVFDMVIGVSAGIVLAALLFMGRMSHLTSAQLISKEKHPILKEPLPPEILLYEIAGPLFFGAAQKAISAIGEIGQDIRVVIFDLSAVPILDMTGLVALETCFQSLHSQNKMAIITGIKKQPATVILKTNLMSDRKKTFMTSSLEEAVDHAKKALRTFTISQ